MLSQSSLVQKRKTLTLNTIFFLFLVLERATRDLRCPQKQVTTTTGQQATLGCYTTQANSSSLKYSWKKDNVTVTSSSHLTVYANMLFVTPENDTDFGTYECHEGVSNTSCSISLRSRQGKISQQLNMFIIRIKRTQPGPPTL